MNPLAEVPSRIDQVIQARDKSTRDQTETIVNLGRIAAELRALVELTRIQAELLLYLAQTRGK